MSHYTKPAHTARQNGEVMRKIKHYRVEIVTERDGKILRGYYWAHNGGMVTAKLGRRQKTTQIGGSLPKVIAKLMMFELHEAAKGNPMFAEVVHGAQ
jgi:hypothetical protein